MKYYLQVDKQFRIYTNLKEVKKLAFLYTTNSKCKYVEWGIIDYDGWNGTSPVQVTKCKEIV